MKVQPSLVSVKRYCVCCEGGFFVVVLPFQNMVHSSPLISSLLHILFLLNNEYVCLFSVNNLNRVLFKKNCQSPTKTLCVRVPDSRKQAISVSIRHVYSPGVQAEAHLVQTLKKKKAIICM